MRPAERKQFPGRCNPLIDQTLSDVGLSVEAVLGEREMGLVHAGSLKPGDVLVLDQDVDQDVTLYVNGKPFARGEIRIIDDRFAVRITRILS